MTAILRLRDIWHGWDGRCGACLDPWHGAEHFHCLAPISRLRYVLVGACKRCRGGA